MDNDWAKDNQFFVDLEHRLEAVREGGIVLYDTLEHTKTGAVMIFGRKGFALAIINPNLPDGIAFMKKFGSFMEMHRWIYGDGPPHPPPIPKNNPPAPIRG